jgi:hypothetical protein
MFACFQVKAAAIMEVGKAAVLTATMEVGKEKVSRTTIIEFKKLAQSVEANDIDLFALLQEETRTTAQVCLSIRLNLVAYRAYQSFDR